MNDQFDIKQLNIKKWTPLKQHPVQIAAYQSRKRFNVIPAGRRCLAKDTMVATPYGPKAIQDLKVGDVVIGYNGKHLEETYITETHDNGLQDVQELTNEYTDIKIKATLNHKLWGSENTIDYKRIELDDICYYTHLLWFPDNGLCCFGIHGFIKGKITKEQTYDITVANETNLYLLANGIVTSNSGKTEIIGKRKQVLRFLLCHDKRYPHYYSPYPDPKFFIAAPTRDQVKRIYWNDIKQLVPRNFLAKPPNESNLILYGKNGAELHLMGLDKPERIEGSPWDHGVVDEIGNVKPNAWQANIRPALSDRKGGCDFIGVPEGRNHYYDMALKAEADRTGEWGYFHWISSDILPPDEIRAAKEDLDELMYRQEYEASFVNFAGLAYYNFDREVHTGEYKQFYNPERPLVICFDFNVSPGIAVICQELGADTFRIRPGKTVTVVLGEVHIPQNSNTQRVCRKIIQDWKYHKGNVICYGDSTGGSKGSAKLRGSDWDIIKDELIPYFGNRLYFNVPKSNPRERQRVNAVNCRLKTATNEVKLVIDKKYCPNLIRDFEGTRILEGTAGEIDKKTDIRLTHMTDGLGYYIFREFPVFQWWDKDGIQRAMKKAA